MATTQDHYGNVNDTISNGDYLLGMINIYDPYTLHCWTRGKYFITALVHYRAH